MDFFVLFSACGLEEKITQEVLSISLLKLSFFS